VRDIVTIPRALVVPGTSGYGVRKQSDLPHHGAPVREQQAKGQVRWMGGMAASLPKSLVMLELVEFSTAIRVRTELSASSQHLAAMKGHGWFRRAPDQSPNLRFWSYKLGGEGVLFYFILLLTSLIHWSTATVRKLTATMTLGVMRCGGA